MKKGIVVLGAFLAFIMVNCEGENAEVEGVVDKNETPEVEQTSVVETEVQKDTMNWMGTYEGSRPCADCEALETELTLSEDKEFKLVEKYKGKSEEVVVRTGKFSFDSTTMNVVLEGEGLPRIKLAENAVVFLNLEGEEVKGETEDLYRLMKKERSLFQTEWELIEFKGQPVTDSLTQLIPTLIIDTINNRASGNASCNQYSGNYQTDGMLLLSFEEMVATKKGCLGANIEQAYLTTLNKVDNYTISNNILSLNKGKMATLMKFEAVEK